MMNTILSFLLLFFVACIVLLIFVIAWLAVAWWTATPLRRLIKRWYGEDGIGDGGQYVFVLTHILFYVFVGIGLYISYKILGWETTVILWIISLFIAFGIAEFVLQIAIGLMVNTMKELHPWTFLEIVVNTGYSGTINMINQAYNVLYNDKPQSTMYTLKGTILSLNRRYMTFESLDKYTYIIPNTFIFTSTFFLYGWQLRSYIDFPLGYQSDLATTEKHIQEALITFPQKNYYDTTNAKIIFTEFADSIIWTKIGVVLDRWLLQKDNISLYEIKGAIIQHIHTHIQSVLPSHSLNYQTITSRL